MRAVRTDGIEKLLACRLGRYVADTVRLSGHEVVTHVVRILQIPATRVAMQQGSGLDPVLVGSIDLEALGTGVGLSAAHITAISFATQPIRQCLMGEREHTFRVQMILPVALRSARLREPVVDLIAAAAARVAQYAVQDATAVFVLVEAEVHEVVERPRRLRNGVAERVLHVAGERIALGCRAVPQE